MTDTHDHEQLADLAEAAGLPRDAPIRDIIAAAHALITERTRWNRLVKAIQARGRTLGQIAFVAYHQGQPSFDPYISPDDIWQAVPSMARDAWERAGRYVLVAALQSHARHCDVIDQVEYAGYRCTIRINPLTGTLCGYVDVPPGHAWHGKALDDLDHLPVHGGITYAEAEPDGTWRVGFDCCHADDEMPRFDIPGRPQSVEYVRQQCRRLAELATAPGDA